MFYVSRNRGFTLIEMVVVIAIIGIISAIILANYRGGQKQYNLQIAKQQVISDIRRAQNMALAALEFKGEVPSGGFGISFNTASPNKYVIFADIDGGKDYDGINEKVQEINLPSKIKISALAPASPLDIVFLPPDPKTYINAGTNDGIITLKEETSGKSQTITITSGGVIE